MSGQWPRARAREPERLAALAADTRALGFAQGSDRAAGDLLRTLAASKPGGSLLELGTGTGLATCWMLDGMDAASTLLSVESDATVGEVARRHLDGDPRVTLVVSDGADHLRALGADARRFDLVFADAWPGKYSHRDAALALVAPGGLYVVDDLLPQPAWPEGHQEKVDALVADLSRRADFQSTWIPWSTGLLVAARSGSAS